MAGADKWAVALDKAMLTCASRHSRRGLNQEKPMRRAVPLEYVRRVRVTAGIALCLGLVGCATTRGTWAPPNLRADVMATERAFAKTMADRDRTAFATFLADEAVFFAGDTPLRGRQAVLDAWAGYFTGPQAPFSWDPTEVEVLDSGTLAISSGPVRDQAGTRVATFTSIWRREPSGAWRVVFDKGTDTCRCASP